MMHDHPKVVMSLKISEIAESLPGSYIGAESHEIVLTFGCGVLGAQTTI